MTIQFKLTAPSKLYWANRPAMYLVQALYWLHDSIKKIENSEFTLTEKKVIRLLLSSKGKKIHL